MQHRVDARVDPTRRVFHTRDRSDLPENWFVRRDIVLLEKSFGAGRIEWPPNGTWLAIKTGPCPRAATASIITTDGLIMVPARYGEVGAGIEEFYIRPDLRLWDAGGWVEIPHSFASLDRRSGAALRQGWRYLCVRTSWDPRRDTVLTALMRLHLIFGDPWAFERLGHLNGRYRGWAHAPQNDPPHLPDHARGTAAVVRTRAQALRRGQEDSNRASLGRRGFEDGDYVGRTPTFVHLAPLFMWRTLRAFGESDADGVLEVHSHPFTPRGIRRRWTTPTPMASWRTSHGVSRSAGSSGGLVRRTLGSPSRSSTWRPVGSSHRRHRRHWPRWLGLIRGVRRARHVPRLLRHPTTGSADSRSLGERPKRRSKDFSYGGQEEPSSSNVSGVKNGFRDAYRASRSRGA